MLIFSIQFFHSVGVMAYLDVLITRFSPTSNGGAFLFRPFLLGSGAVV